MKDQNYGSGSYKQKTSLSCTKKLKTRFHAGASVIAAICLSLGSGPFAHTQTLSPIPNKVQKEKVMTTHASGTFEVKLTPQDDKSEDANLGRMTIDKQFHGDLEATSKGQMLS